VIEGKRIATAAPWRPEKHVMPQHSCLNLLRPYELAYIVSGLVHIS